MRLKHKPVISVQFHPKAAPGPHDAHGSGRGIDIFAEFFALVRGESIHAKA
jgi:carbamoylphosphate synthase small subunit